MALSVAVAVGDAAADLLVSKMAEAMTTLKIGPCHDANNDFGPVITKQHQQKVFGYIDSAENQGATIVVDGRNPSVTGHENGFYVGGTLIDQVTPEMESYDAEIFGPVLTIQTFRTIDEVIQKANNSPYGLAAGVWTDKGSRIFNLTSKLRAGVIWANTYNKFDPASPFGGYKESGFGREGGLHGLEAYLK